MFYQCEIDRMLKSKKKHRPAKDVRWKIEYDGFTEYVYDLKKWAFNNGLFYDGVLKAARAGIEYKNYKVSRI